MSKVPFTPPKSNFIDLWIVDLSTLPAAVLTEHSTPESVLDKQEMARSKDFKYAKDSTSFLIRRVALRRILSLYTRCQATDLDICRYNHDKPYLRNRDVEFNTSLSADFALVAISDQPIGVDIEFRKDLKDEFISIAKTILSQDELAVLIDKSVPEDLLVAFYDFWCLKEAYLKAIGLGFSIDPRLITFDLATHTLRQAANENTGTEWHFHALELIAGYTTAIASSIAVPKLRVLDYTSLQ